ncbi:MAG TPA: NUDIX domain-containing protein [Candidatus Paceibacterota bacterium]
MERGGVEAVASVLIVKDGKILLIKSPKWDDSYLVPGGHIDRGETIIDAATREGEEETGLKLKSLYCVNVGESIFDPSFYRKAHLIYFHFVCQVVGGEISPDAREVREFFWFDPKEALNLKLTKGVRKTIENYINGVRIDLASAKF